MAVSGDLRLDRLVFVSADPEALAGFYLDALGFARAEAVPLPQAPGEPRGAQAVGLRLGEQRIDLVAFAPAGAPYPGDVAGWSPLFQHAAIVVSDMAAAYARLTARSGWRPISKAGPERLPASSGGVTAFKFHDPEGHPLELLAFPPDSLPERWRDVSRGDPCLGIDHTALSVADTDASLAFYARLGLHPGTRSHNTGPEQARMDAVPGADVAVTGLDLPGGGPPHVELLGYRGDYPRPASRPGPADIAATRTVFALGPGGLDALCARLPEARRAPDGTAAWLDDPDGHRLVLVAGG